MLRELRQAGVPRVEALEKGEELVYVGEKVCNGVRKFEYQLPEEGKKILRAVQENLFTKEVSKVFTFGKHAGMHCVLYKKLLQGKKKILPTIFSPFFPFESEKRDVLEELLFREYAHAYSPIRLQTVKRVKKVVKQVLGKPHTKGELQAKQADLCSIGRGTYEETLLHFLLAIHLLKVKKVLILVTTRGEEFRKIGELFFESSVCISGVVVFKGKKKLNNGALSVFEQAIQEKGFRQMYLLDVGGEVEEPPLKRQRFHYLQLEYRFEGETEGKRLPTASFSLFFEPVKIVETDDLYQKLSFPLREEPEILLEEAPTWKRCELDLPTFAKFISATKPVKIEDIRGIRRRVNFLTAFQKINPRYIAKGRNMWRERVKALSREQELFHCWE